MGTSHVDSSMEAITGDENITGFATISGVTLTGSGTTSGAIVSATNYVKIGDHKYIFNTAYTTEASILAVATAVDASVKGSMALGVGNLWVFDADDSAKTASLT